MFNRTTLRRPIAVSGTGLHSGAPGMVRITPSRLGLGIRACLSGGLPQSLSTIEVLATERCTRLRFEDGRTLDTVEHLMAAIAITGLTDADIEFSSPETPILDGSALPWVNAIVWAGLLELGGVRPVLRVTKNFHFSHKGATYSVSPGRLHYDVGIDFPGTVIGNQRVRVSGNALRTLSDSRTFAMESEIQALRSAGLALGGGLHNAVVIGPEGPVNPEGFRHPDECVRHKALDLVGDLHLLGRQIIGRFVADRPGHSANNAFLRAMVSEGVISGILEVKALAA